MNLFQMSLDELEEWFKTDEGQKLIDDCVKYIDNEIKNNPYFSAPDCWRWSCPYNSGHNHDVEMGEITYCHKWKDDEEHEPCPDIEEDWII